MIQDTSIKRLKSFIAQQVYNMMVCLSKVSYLYSQQTLHIGIIRVFVKIRQLVLASRHYQRITSKGKCYDFSCVS